MTTHPTVVLLLPEALLDVFRIFCEKTEYTIEEHIAVDGMYQAVPRASRDQSHPTT